MIVAVVGCLHGKLDFLYQELQQWELQTNRKVDFILCCGDFQVRSMVVIVQSLRDEKDMQALECPQKYKQMGQFQMFYQNQKRAPILTIFVGGNHEATNYLRDLYYGGWAAENIYFLGASGVTKGNETLRIGGISGIEKHYDYQKGYYERWPYIDDHNALRSIYHIREFEVQKLKLLDNRSLDIFISHEWPNVVTQRAEKKELQQLLKIKPYFKNDAYQGKLGAQCLSEILDELEPKFWLAAHLHVKFNTKVYGLEGNTVEFLALDKPIPNRQYLDVFELNSDTQELKSIFKNYQKQQSVEEVKEQELKLSYDQEWISILQETQEIIPLSYERQTFAHISKHNKELMQNLKQRASKITQQDLLITYNEDLVKQAYERVNPQTKLFIEKFGLDTRLFNPSKQIYVKKNNKEELKQSQIDEEDIQSGKRTFAEAFQSKPVKDDNEIDLDLE